MPECPACSRLVPPSRGYKPRVWCSLSCCRWAKRHPGERRDPDWAPFEAQGPRVCANCGKQFLVPGRTSAKFCSRPCCGRATAARLAVGRRTECAEPGCAGVPKIMRRRDGRSYIGKRCAPCHRLRYPEDPEVARARARLKTYARKSRTKRLDLPIADERRLRAKAKRCPMCRVKLVDQPYLSTSKELDHIVPLNQGGAHNIHNVRIICRACNIHRPKDGSDFVGQLSLFAMDCAA